MGFSISEKYILKFIIHSKIFIKHLLCVKDEEVSSISVTSAFIEFIEVTETLKKVI